MQFRTEINKNLFSIYAKISSRKEKFGFQNEFTFKKISLVQDEVRLEFDFIPQNPHPDIIALICICAFYTYIKDPVEFPSPISEKAKNAIENFCLRKRVDGKPVKSETIRVVNWSKTLTKYEGGENVILAFGGGMDSTTCSIMFPEAILVNQLDTLDQKPAMLKLFERMKSKNPKLKYYTNFTNIRSLSKPYGFTGPECSLLLPLLLAGDLNASGMMTGTIMNAQYLSKEAGEFNKNVKNWQFKEELETSSFESFPELFKGIGIYCFTPVGGSQNY